MKTLCLLALLAIPACAFDWASPIVSGGITAYAVRAGVPPATLVEMAIRDDEPAVDSYRVTVTTDKGKLVQRSARAAEEWTMVMVPLPPGAEVLSIRIDELVVGQSAER